MRYKKDETTVLGGLLAEDEQVTIKILNHTGNEIQLSSNVCTQAPGYKGLYTWSTTNMSANPGTYFYVMTDGTNRMPGKFVYGGYIDTVAEKEDVEVTNTKVDSTNATIVDSREELETLMGTIGASVLAGISEGNQDLRTIIEDVQLGNWEIKDTEMVMRSASGVEIARFGLYDQYGQPNGKSVFKRIRI